ncbi:MAG: NYN domain-containing protein [Rhodobacteraceae bacterium]|nr:NYN domain-containing protein [Paracoccaceae bacterium]
MARAGIPLLAVLVDADNSSPAWAEAIFEEIASLGEASVRRIYGDFSRPAMKGWSDRLASLALVPHHQPANTVGKNASDIALVIDAMDLLHSGRFDGFVLISSDSDFTRLASRIREHGLDVYGIGQQKTPEAFRKACKRFIFVENLLAVPDAEPDERAEPERPARKMPPSKAVPLIEAAMRAIGEDEDWYSLGQIGQFITAANPDFDSRSYGSAKLSDLLQKTGKFELRRGEGNQTLPRPRP